MTTPGNIFSEPGHVRQGSSGRGAPQLPRRSTRGPLDLAEAPVSDPLAVGTATPPHTSRPTSLLSQHPLNSPLIDIGTAMPALPVRGVPMSPAPTAPRKAFSHLLRPELYHPLPSTSIPEPLLNVTSSDDIALLLSSSQFRNAAIVAAHKLTTSTAPSDFKTIFELLYVRLACLTLINQTSIAAQEVKVLEDLNSAVYIDDQDGHNLVPWELRVLAVRLQGIGYGDPRKGVTGYYDLAREARAELQSLGGEIEISRIWQERLKDLGIRVASALVEMGDLAGAAAHLQTLRGDTLEKEAAFREALLWLKIGDVDRARDVINSGDDEPRGEEESVIMALAKMAEGSYGEAAGIWRGMLERVDRERKWEGEEMWRVNLGVCLLYSGQIGEARDIMESTIASGTAFYALTFNLSTIYELSTDRSRALKIGLVEKVAALQDTPSFTNTDFKL